MALWLLLSAGACLSVRKSLHRFASTHTAFLIGMAFALAPAIVVGFWAMQALQHRYIPIVSNVSFTEIVKDIDGDVVLTGYFDKNFKENVCKFDALRWYMPDIESTGDVIKHRVEATYEDKRKTEADNNRHQGRNYFFGWKIGTSEHPDQRQVTGYVKHVCLGFIPTRTMFPVVAVPE